MVALSLTDSQISVRFSKILVKILHGYTDLQWFWTRFKDFITLTQIFENLTKILESADESVTNRSGVKFHMDIVIWGIFWAFPEKLPETISFCKNWYLNGLKTARFRNQIRISLTSINSWQKNTLDLYFIGFFIVASWSLSKSTIHFFY